VKSHKAYLKSEILYKPNFDKLLSLFKWHLMAWIFLMGTPSKAQEVKSGALLYTNPFNNPADIKDWKMEGLGVAEIKDASLQMYSPDESGHHVFWCPVDFPESFIAEWDARNEEPDAGLCIVFFSAKGINGESIFDSSLPKRTTGFFSDYTKAAMNCYHISYYANAKDDPHRDISHLRKNKGFHLVQQGKSGIPMNSTDWHHLKLIKNQQHIMMYLDDREIINWTDPGTTYGPVLTEGKIGLRQMKWTHFAYRNFNVWSLK
jgi:hypothetical protein